jgi:peptide/nickel transport system ATP-binding protein
MMKSTRRLLTVKNLAVDFDTPRGMVNAVNDISFHVDEGEMVAVVGESGSGKSVTAYSVLGLLATGGRAVADTINYLGQDLLRAGPSALKTTRGNEISMIFQSPQTALNPIRPIAIQIADVLRAHQRLSGAEAAKRAIAALEAVDIQDAAHRLQAYPFEFSGGMCQRALIAMALACEPRLLLADEPTTGLDVTTQKTVMDLIVTLTRSRDMSTLFITHDLGLAAQYCDRIIIMQNGRVVEEGETAKIFNDPRDNYTKGLLAATPHLHTRLLDLLPSADRRPFLAPVAATSVSARAVCGERQTVLKVDSLVQEYGLGPVRRRIFEKLRKARGL